MEAIERREWTRKNAGLFTAYLGAKTVGLSITEYCDLCVELSVYPKDYHVGCTLRAMDAAENRAAQRRQERTRACRDGAHKAGASLPSDEKQRLCIRCDRRKGESEFYNSMTKVCRECADKKKSALRKRKNPQVKAEIKPTLSEINPDLTDGLSEVKAQNADSVQDNTDKINPTLSEVKRTLSEPTQENPETMQAEQQTEPAIEQPTEADAIEVDNTIFEAVAADPDRLKGLTDEAILQELKSRNFRGKLVKTIEIEFEI